jgi:hypothetical protein
MELGKRSRRNVARRTSGGRTINAGLRMLTGQKSSARTTQACLKASKRQPLGQMTCGQVSAAIPQEDLVEVSVLCSHRLMYPARPPLLSLCAVLLRRSLPPYIGKVPSTGYAKFRTVNNQPGFLPDTHAAPSSQSSQYVPYHPYLFKRRPASHCLHTV